MKIFYKARATAIGGRTGHAALDDGSLAFDLAAPGTGKLGVNPEQLFAIGYAACFDNAIKHVAEKQKLSLAGSKTSAEVGIGPNKEGGFALDVDLYVEIRGLSDADASRLVEATHQVCPYSNALRGNVDVRLHVTAA